MSPRGILRSLTEPLNVVCHSTPELLTVEFSSNADGRWSCYALFAFDDGLF